MLAMLEAPAGAGAAGPGAAPEAALPGDGDEGDDEGGDDEDGGGAARGGKPPRCGVEGAGSLKELCLYQARRSRKIQGSTRRVSSPPHLSPPATPGWSTSRC
jgi:hypothetical protein